MTQVTGPGQGGGKPAARRPGYAELTGTWPAQQRKGASLMISFPLRRSDCLPSEEEAKQLRAALGSRRQTIIPGPQESGLVLAPACRAEIWCPFYLMVSPQSSQAVGIHYPEYFGFFVLPSDEVFVPGVRKQLIDVIPKQSTVCRGKGQENAVENVSCRDQERESEHS